MAQDAAGRPYLQVLILFLLIAGATTALVLFRKKIPFSGPLLWVGATIVGLGLLLGAYFTYLAMSGTSSAEYQRYLEGLREDERQREATTQPTSDRIE